MRRCEICGSASAELIYKQQFTTLSEGSLLEGYDVVHCIQCGFSFADKIPDPSCFESYYREMSKYEHDGKAGHVSHYKRDFYNSVVAKASPFMHVDASVLDIGCATGALLAAFKAKGFANCLGIDPSPRCAEIARKLYDIEVQTRAISDLGSLGRQVDLVTLCSVLEHIPDLRLALELLRSAVSDRGVVFVEVPDATRFAEFISAPFQQFSVEHINYFSPTSLANLMHAHGFMHLQTWQESQQCESMAEPSLFAIFRKTSGPAGDYVPDRDSAAALRRYISKSREMDAPVRQRVDDLVGARKAIIVWGVGTHTQRLLATTNLGDADIVAFVDSDPHYHDKTLRGVPVVPPSSLSGRREPILISSQGFQQEIARQIRESLMLENELILLY